MNDKHYAIVASRFNTLVCEKLLSGALERFSEKAIQHEKITVIRVPGAVEIPLVVQQLARKKHYAGIICLGAVIRGETTHYDYVCQQVSYGCQRVALDFETPIIFGVLTTENTEQALDRLGGKHGHKGKEAVDTVLEMTTVLQALA